MKRNDREIKNTEKIFQIIKNCKVCNLALFDENYPYIVPMNFGFDFLQGNLSLYFHGASVGKKHTLIDKNPNAAFCIQNDYGIILSEVSACASSIQYESVCGTGKIVYLENDEKINALNCIMKQYDEKTESFSFNEKMLSATTVFALRVDRISAKSNIKA